MADEKKKEDDKDEGKKKGMSPIVMIAIGAIVGGAGATFVIPPKTVEVETPAPVYEDIDVTHPDVIYITFNPKSRSGKGISKIGYKFVYTVREDREGAAFARLKERWDDVKSESLKLFKLRSTKELNTEKGLTLLEHDLVVRLDELLFPDNDEWVAGGHGGGHGDTGGDGHGGGHGGGHGDAHGGGHGEAPSDAHGDAHGDGHGAIETGKLASISRVIWTEILVQ